MSMKGNSLVPVPKLIDGALNAHGANLRFDGTASFKKELGGDGFFWNVG
jgi:hypothetical protein